MEGEFALPPINFRGMKKAFILIIVIIFSSCRAVLLKSL